MDLNRERVKKIFSEFSNKKILVIGDVMMDAYYWGKTERISPEAPVPIVEVEHTNYNPGGAGNVALNLSALGAQVSIITVIGRDNNGNVLIDLLETEGIDISKILLLEEYNTPIKTRVIAQDQQVIRIDKEKNSIDINNYLDDLKQLINKEIDKFDGVILADYNKGLLSRQLIRLILKIAGKKEVPVYVDPKHKNFLEYKGVRLFKPNLVEFKIAIDNSFNIDNIIDYGRKFLIDSGSDMLLITRGAQDALLFIQDINFVIPTITQSVHDVSGAGDTVIATFALADACGAEPVESANIANIAASIVCSKVGVVPIKIDELKASLLK